MPGRDLYNNVRRLAQNINRGYVAPAVRAGIDTAINGLVPALSQAYDVSQTIGWDMNAEQAQDALRFAVGAASALTPVIEAVVPRRSGVRGKRKRPGSAVLQGRSILESPSTGSTTDHSAHKRLRSSSSLSLPTHLDPWYKGYRPPKLDLNSSPRSQEWLKWTPSFSSQGSGSLQRRGNRYRKVLSWFNTCTLVRARRNLKLRKAKALKNNRAARLLFARRPLPQLRFRRQVNPRILARLKQTNWRRHHAAKKSLAFAARQYRRLVRSRQRSRRRR